MLFRSSDDVIYANRSLLCLHTASQGAKQLRLPQPAVVTDLWTGQQSEGPVTALELTTPAYRTFAWHTNYQTQRRVN